MNPVEGDTYLRAVNEINPYSLVDIDETGSDASQIGNTSGYAPRGERYMRTQYVVRGVHYSVIAAASPCGFLHWKIVEGSVSDDVFISFLNELSVYLIDSSFGIIDNASVHRTIDTRIRLEQSFNGRYLFCTTYHPHFKPIEKCLSPW